MLFRERNPSSSIGGDSYKVEITFPDDSDPPNVTFTLCDDISITTEPCESMENIPNSEDVVITPIGPDGIEENEIGIPSPVQAALFASGVHFLSHESLLVPKQEPVDDIEESDSSSGFDNLLQGRRDLLEYLMQEDGSVICKWCGEVLPSRTHWYRHKYKLHVSTPPGTSNLFKCHRCNVFFKSRKGYVGHVSSRHSSSDANDSSDNVNNENINNKLGITTDGCSNSKNNNTSDSLTVNSIKIKRNNLKSSSEEFPGNLEEYEKQREREEKLVADIIDRVKRECEAQGSTVTRRGYSRRSTVMNS